MITFLCSKCGEQHSVPAEWAGKSAKCPCGKKLDVPCIVKLEPEDNQPELPDDTADDNDFAFDPNDFSAIPSIARTIARKRTPWWFPVAKFLSAAAVAALLFFGYPHYSPHLKKLFSPPAGQEMASKDPVNRAEPTRSTTTNKYEHKPSIQKPVPKTSLRESTDNHYPVEHEIEAVKPRKERPFLPTVAEVFLPSGRTISVTALSPNPRTQEAIQQIPNTEHYCQKDLNGQICAVCQYNSSNGKIEGLVMRTHPNGMMSSLSRFDNSKLSGPLRCWNKHGQLIYYGDWVNEKKQGITCLFDEEKPVLIQEWKADNILCQYRVSYEDEVTPKVEKVTLDSESTKQYQEQVTNIEQDIDDADTELRKSFSHDFREKAKEIRLQRAAQLSPQKRDLILKRMESRQLQEQAAETAFWQRATTGYKWDTRRRWPHWEKHPIEVKVTPLR